MPTLDLSGYFWSWYSCTLCYFVFCLPSHFWPVNDVSVLFFALHNAYNVCDSWIFLLRLWAWFGSWLSVSGYSCRLFSMTCNSFLPWLLLWTAAVSPVILTVHEWYNTPQVHPGGVPLFSFKSAQLSSSDMCISYVHQLCVTLLPDWYFTSRLYFFSFLGILCSLAGSLSSGFLNIISKDLWSLSTSDMCLPFRYWWNFSQPHTIAMLFFCLSIQYNVAIKQSQHMLIVPGFVFGKQFIHLFSLWSVLNAYDVIWSIRVLLHSNRKTMWLSSYLDYTNR